MKHPDIAAYTVEHGGGTFEAGTLLPFEPKVGYAVGIGGITLNASMATAVALSSIAKRVAQEWEASFVGTWLDGGVIYVDAVRYVRDLPSALRYAREANQVAVYDFSIGEAIPVTLNDSGASAQKA